MMNPRKGYKFVKSFYGKYEEIPEEWEKVELETVSKKITDMDHKMPKKVTDGIPFISVGYVMKNPTIFLEIDRKSDSIEFISNTEYEKHSKKFNAEKGDLLYTRFGSIGTAKIINSAEKMLASYSVVLIKPNREIIDSLFLCFVLNSDNLRLQSKIRTKGTANKNLHMEDIRKLNIPLPPFSEQQKIASILSNVDSLINQNHREIEQTQLLKKGLMQKLPTRGIGHKKFKKIQSFYGKYEEIPEEWIETTIKDVTELIIDKRGKTPKKLGIDWSEKGIPVLSAMNIENGKLQKEESIRFINEDAFDKWMSEKLKIGDVILTSEAPLGKAFIITDPNYCIGQRLYALRPNSKKVTSEYLYHYLLSNRGQNELIKRSTGSTVKGIRQEELLKIGIVLPTLSEQQKIASILSNVDSEIQKQQKYKLNLETLKKGLMQKLLTSEIRVKY